MGYKFHERVDIDDSTCGGIYNRTDVYSKEPILVDRYPDHDQYYLNDNWQPPPGTIYGKLKYDSSFEWLHKVIERIESLGYHTVISYRRGGEGNYHEMLILEDNHIVAETLYRALDEEESIAITWIKEAEKKTKLEAVYRAVVNFIKYYNLKQILNESSLPD